MSNYQEPWGLALTLDMQAHGYMCNLEEDGVPGGALPVYWGSVREVNGSLYLVQQPVTYSDIGQIAIDLMSG